MHLTDHPLLILDGACGSNIQLMDLPDSAWSDKQGCNEYLNLSAPDAIIGLHDAFLDAGATVVETNTFGANRIVLAEYDLADDAARINHAAVEHARKAVGTRRAYVAGSIGPTTRLPSLGQISFEALSMAYAEQVRALLEAGADLLIVETCQDLMQAKIALVSCHEVFDELGCHVPIVVSLTVEQTGTMLVGADVAAAAAAIEPFGVFALGLNCATGPEMMTSHIRWLSSNWSGRISCIPNAGIPSLVDGQTVYPLSPTDFADRLKRFVMDDGVSVLGGCCGTTPEHIRALVDALRNVAPADRQVTHTGAVSSGYQAVEIAQDIPPLLIGERTNANGSKQFRDLLLADDFQGCLKIALQQQDQGAHAIDVCTAYVGRDETADMHALTRLIAESVRLPVVIDSTRPECVEVALRTLPGRCLINSINLEDGGPNLDRLCTLARKYGAGTIALTINESGMAMTADDKVATAKAIHDLAVNTYGLKPGDLLFDPLTFTIGAGDENLRDAAIQTLEAIRRIKTELPGVHTVLGVSNISFGLPPGARRILNSVFLNEAVEAGLDAAIVDAGKILPLVKISEEDRQVCLDLIYDRQPDGSQTTPLMTFIEHFAEHTETTETDEAEQVHLQPEQQLRGKVIDGDRDGIDDLVEILLQRHKATEIINQVLVPAMRHVGELFGRGEMLLPFVLQSAEAMKHSVSLLEPHMDKADAQSGLKILLATVQGDVHDIGKNLVDIILSNNGYQVINLGIKVPAETIIAKAREHDVDVIGLSGLLVKSAIIMQESMPHYQAAGLDVPILLGGAALTEKFVADSCVPQYGKPVVYCADAFAGLRAVQELEAGTLSATTFDASTAVETIKPGPRAAQIARDVPVPTPPCFGARHVVDIDPAVLFGYINEQALFRGRWGYRRGKMDADEYNTLIAEKVRPLYEEFQRRSIDEGLVQPKVAYGYFRCHSDDQTLHVDHDGDAYAFTFPRQADPPHVCIADFYKTADEGGDVVGFFVVTIGEAMDQATHKLFADDHYHDYVLLHAYGVEVTDALAEYWHEVMRQEMGLQDVRPATLAGYARQDYQGSRYGFGYPACPDLDAHKAVFAMLQPEAIGVTLTESMEMVPEQSTSAIVAHHRQAKYFAV